MCMDAKEPGCGPILESSYTVHRVSIQPILGSHRWLWSSEVPLNEGDFRTVTPWLTLLVDVSLVDGPWRPAADCPL